jgi:outer membrane protein assembly factor BamB
LTRTNISRIIALAWTLALWLAAASPAQAQWAFRAGGTNPESGDGLAVLENGDVVVVGSTTPQADFDPDPNTTVSFNYGGFLASYTGQGQLRWALPLAKAGGHDVVAGPEDDLFVLSGSCTIHRFTRDGIYRWHTPTFTDSRCRQLAYSGSSLYVRGLDGFVARLDPDHGTVLWSITFPTGDESVTDVAVGLGGSVILSGHSAVAFDADPGEGEAIIEAPTGNSGGYLISLDASGAYLWSRVLDASGWEQLTRLGSDESGDVYLGGSFGGTIDLGGGPVHEESKAFVAKYSASGRLLWTRDTENGSFRSFAVRGSLLTVAGNSRPTPMNFDPDSDPSTEVVGRGMFIARFDTTGAHEWIISLPGHGSIAWAVGMDSQGSTFITGWLWPSTDFDPGPGELILTAEPPRGDLPDFFLAKYGIGGAFAVSTEGEHQLPERMGLTPPYPNPSRGQVRFELVTHRLESLRIALYDVLGRLVKTTHEGPFGPGTHDITLDVAGLSPGAYKIVVLGSEVRTASIIVH